MRTLYLLLLLIMGSAVHAALVEPMPMLYSSNNGKFTLCIIPATNETAHAFPNTDPRLTEAIMKNRHCVATLFEEYLSDNVKYSKWIIVLPNRIAPMSAIVAESGKFLATSGEYGVNDKDSLAICLFNGDGELIKSYRIADLVDKERIAELPEICGNIFWGRLTGFDEVAGNLIADVWEEGEILKADTHKFRRVLISLKTGEPVKKTDNAQPQ